MQREVYHFRFLFATGETQRRKGQMVALGGCDRRPEWTAGLVQKAVRRLRNGGGH
jgi:hypothetical protein